MSSTPPPATAGKGKGVPPPKGLGKGPPPPRGGAAGKGPPMIPGGAARSREALGAPKLRPLFWTAVNQVPQESVWTDLVAPAPFDQALLELQFALTDSRIPSSAAGGKAGSRSASEEPRKRVRVLDDRTSQMLAIAFNRLPPPEQVAEMVDTLEDFPDGLTSEAVLALHNAVSEHGEAVEQIRLVATNQETIAQLDMPERFLLRLSTVPHCSLKLACGALIVGSAKELMDLRLSGQKVGVCCQEIRKSKLLRKIISTSLAVGNCLNRGTARSGVRGVVLPDSLLKLDELRGTPSGDLAGDATDKDRGVGSVLDFVAQALVNEEGMKDVDLQKEAENLLAKARAASGVSLEETQTNCQQVNNEAVKVKQSFTDMPPSPGLERVKQRVDRICEEAALANDIAQKAKDQLTKLQVWSCCKGKVKSCDWFASWAQFLELLPRALGRAQEAKAQRLAQEEADRRLVMQRPPLASADVNAVPAVPEDSFKKRVSEIHSIVQATRGREEKKPQAQADTQPSSRAATKPSSKAALDDDARIDNIDWSQVNKHHAALFQVDPDKRPPAPVLAMAFDNKENSMN